MLLTGAPLYISCDWLLMWVRRSADRNRVVTPRTDRYRVATLFAPDVAYALIATIAIGAVWSMTYTALVLLARKHAP